MIRLKVDGVADLHEARICAAGGADYIGFELEPGRPRYVPPATVREIAGWISGPQPVGLFAEAPAEEVVEACEKAGLRLAQVESDADVCAVIAAAGVEVIRSFTVRHDASAEQLRSLFEPFAGVARYFRLDTNETSLWGGEGVSLHWRVVRELAGESDLFLAGSPADGYVGEVLRMRPFALDVDVAVRDAAGELDAARLDALSRSLAEASR